MELSGIREELARCFPGGEVSYKESLTSTNDWAKSVSGQTDSAVRLYLADTQTAGRGRRGHAWSSEPATSVSMSLVLRPPLAPESFSMLTLVMGLSATQAIEEVSGMAAGIKWPNDIVVRGRKICGILTEMAADLCRVIIGIGVNVNQETFPDELKGLASSLFLETGRRLRREDLICSILRKFTENYQIFCREGDLSLLRDLYEEKLVNCGERVRVLSDAGAYQGLALGITDRGELLVRPDGEEAVEKVMAGEVSVRGIYGYVDEGRDESRPCRERG